MVVPVNFSELFGSCEVEMSPFNSHLSVCASLSSFEIYAAGHIGGGERNPENEWHTKMK